MKLGWLLLLIWLLNEPAMATHRALLVGIGHYPPGRIGTSAARDQYYIKQLLQQQQFGDLTTLTDNQATAQGIRHALTQLVLRCQPGDKLVFHYAGHGTQLPDQNGDEGDGWDEALVPYDAPRSEKFMPINKERFIRDDELAIFLSQLRDKLGPDGHVLLLMDACHSGTLTRGQARLRTDQYQIRNVPAPKKSLSDWLDVLPAFSRGPGNAGKVILMAGSQASEPTYETLDDEKQAIGSLTYAFCRAMTDITSTDTYLSLFDRVRTELHRKIPEQLPTLEGDTYELVWAGDVISSSVWAGTRWLGRQILLLGKGLLAGYGTGSVVRISRGDGRSINGEIVESNPFEARIQLQDSLSLADSTDLQIQLIRQALPEIPLRVSLQNLEIDAYKNQAINSLRSLPSIQFVTDGADWLIERSGKQWCLLRAASGSRVGCVPTSARDALADQLALVSRMTLLRDLALPNARLRATVTLQNARLTPDEQHLGDTLPTATERGWGVFRPGQQAWLRIANTGDAPFYYALVDLQPDGQPTMLLPNEAYLSRNLYLTPGQQTAFPVSRFTPPYGQETYKLLLTAAPVDWQMQLPGRRQTIVVSNSLNPFSYLLAGPVRGQVNSSLSLANVGIATLNFWIKPIR